MIYSSPYHINWNYTDKCNFNCRHCYTRRRENKEELSRDEALKTAEILAKANVFQVNLGGGEPLLRKDVFQVIKKLSSFNIRTMLSSNGWIPDDMIIKELKKNNLNTIYISIDHSKSEIHDYIRNKNGSHARAIECIEKCNTFDLNVSLSVVISKYNWEDLDNIIGLIRKLDIKKVNFKRFRPVGNGAFNSNEFMLDDKNEINMLKKIEYIIKNTKDIEIYLLYAEFPIPGISDGCPCGSKSLAIFPNGDIARCVYGKMILGNILKDDIIEIWQTHPFIVTGRINHVCEGLIIN